MLKQKPLSYYQSSVLSKKPKKRSTSTSVNKQNLSMSHNNSSSLQCNADNKKSILTKNTKNTIANKQKLKKTKKSQTRQRSTSKLLSVANNLINQQNKHITVKLRQSQGLNKKIKKSRNNSSSMIFVDNDYQAHEKTIDNKNGQLSSKHNNIDHKYASVLNFHPLMSKSSTIVSSSTGNIQFSQWSKQDQHEKNYDILDINQLSCFNKPLISSQRVDHFSNSARPQTSLNKNKLTSTKAAIMIQKTWRGYLTRKLLEQYIESFEPIYEEQLKEIRSGRQSRQQVKSIISTHKKCHQKSSFFDRSQLQECSEIEPLQSHTSQSFRTTNNRQNEPSSLLFTEINQNQSFIRKSTQIKKSSAKNMINPSKTNEHYDIPVQFFKKPIRQNKRQDEVLLTSKNQEMSCSSRRKNAMKITPQTASRVSEFTVKNNIITTQNTSLKQEPVVQQTLKFPQYHKHRSISLCSKTTSLYISPSQSKPSPIEQLHLHCTSLSTLFHKFNSMCIADMKTQVKLNKLSLNQLMQRKDALKDIHDNGMEFVQNVKEQISKAFGEMKRLVKEGCDSSSDRDDRDNDNSQQRNIKNSTQRSDVSNTIKVKPQSHQTSNQQSHQNHSPSPKISNQKYMHDLQSSSQSQQIDSSSSRKYYSGSKRHNPNAKSGTSEFYTIELPTQEYSIKGKSPIQQDYDQDDEQSDQEEQYSSAQDMNSQQQENHQHQQSYTQRTLPMNSLYSSHQQSLQILNQFLLNLIEQYQQLLATKNISQLEYLCQTLKRVSCDSQNKTIIDRCLIEFIVEIMSQTWTLREIYDGFRRVLQQGIVEKDQDEQQQNSQQENQTNQDDTKLESMIRKWIQQLYKWQMNIIQQVPSKMQSSSFINTQNISINQLRDAVNNLSNLSNLQLDFTNYK